MQPVPTTHTIGPTTERSRRAEPARRLRVLTIDDNHDSADSMGMLLRLFGAEVEVVYDGASALALARSWRPDAVLLDITMPGMDGYAVAQHLRGMFADDPVTLIALTGIDRPQDRVRAREAGFDHRLIKPVDPQVLEALLREVRAARRVQ